MVKFGFMTNPVAEIVKNIRDIHNLGFDYVEIGIEWPEGSIEMLIKKRKKILQEIKRFNSPPLGHTAWWMDFTSPYEHVRKAWVEDAKRKILVAKSLGIKLLNFHTSSRYSKEFYNKEIVKITNNYIRSMREIIPFAKNHGMTVMLENAAENGEIRTFTDYKRVLDKLPDAKVHLDIAHAHINGGMEAVQKFIEYFKDRIVHIHVHDNHGELDEHLPIGSGSIDFEKVVKMLKKINYDKTVTFEDHTSRSDAVKSREKFRKLWNTVKI